MKYTTNLFKGRLNRVNFLIGFVLSLVVLMIGMQIEFLVIPTMIIVFIFGLSLQVRRWHDFNRPWYYAISVLLFTMFIGILSKDIGNLSKLIYLVILVVIKGNNGKNRYGDEDKTVSFKSILGLLS